MGFGPKCTCLIPFYNEEKRILYTLQKMEKIENFSHIICIDDGSTDQSKNIVQLYIKQNPKTNISLVKLPYNQGKTQAIREGVKYITTPLVFLMDADLSRISPKEISTPINHMQKHDNIDLIILRRLHSYRYLKLFRRELILSGQRVLKTQDLKNIMTGPMDKYQLEIAINMYMQQHNKNIYRMPFTAKNLFKTKKRGIFSGLQKELGMLRDIFSYRGPFSLRYHIITFRPKLLMRKYDIIKK